MDKPNILFIVWDATRHDICSCYGYPQKTTPHLDQLAEDGTLYEQAITAAPWTLPAMTSIFTGLYPSQTDIYLRRKLTDDYQTLAELFQQGGYATFGISNNDWFSADFGLQRGFDYMHKLWQLFQTQNDITNLSVVEPDRSDSRIANNALRKALRGKFLQNAANAVYYKTFRNFKDHGASRTAKPLTQWIARQQKPWFAFVHYLDPHLQYRPPLEFVKQFAHDLPRCQRLLKSDQWRLCWRHNAGIDLLSEEDLQAWRDLYLAEVAYTDYHTGQVITWLKKTGQWENTAVIITADHGENLGEHGLLNHSYSLHDPLAHVPLVIRHPGGQGGGQRVAQQVQTIDLFATMLDMAGLPIPPHVVSQSLLAESYDRQFALSEYGMPIPPHAAAMARFGLKPEDLAYRQKGMTALRSTTHKLVLDTNGAERLFDLQADPQELHDIASAQPELMAAYRQALRDIWQRHGIRGLIGLPTKYAPVDPELEKRLHDLGYLE
ncbi:MAG: sulfatase [Ardenticatenaceae bacterium]|nr:sulfatase [Anaerolineales bacterium]MCB8921044.1 sulfatase [Ardenticatenaceae bacterium]MCB8991192.1 sulfatase [Ardenticatenaceae bacterium]